METYNIKLLSVSGKTSEIEVTYPDSSKKVIKIDGFPVNTDNEVEFISAAKKYMTDLLSGEASNKGKEIIPSTAVSRLVGKSTSIEI